MKVLIDKAERFQKAPKSNLGPAKLSQKLLQRRGLQYIDLDSIKPYKLVLEPALVDRLSGSIEPASLQSIAELKSAISKLYSAYLGRPLNPETEIVLTPGGRLTVSLLFLALVNPGDIVSLPDPGLSAYRFAAVMAGAEIRPYPLLEKNDYLPNLTFFNDLGRRLKLVIVNYPHNPTGAEADVYFYRDLLMALKRYNTLIVADCHYCGISNPPIALPLQLPRSSNRVVELHSFAFPYGIGNLGFALGHKDAIANLAQILDSFGVVPIDYQVKLACQEIANHDRIESAYLDMMAKRRRALIDLLHELGWPVRQARHGPYIWAKIPPRATAAGFARKVFAQTGVRIRPGSDFGEHGEGFIRLSLTVPDDLLETAVRSIREAPGLRRRMRL